MVRQIYLSILLSLYKINHEFNKIKNIQNGIKNHLMEGVKKAIEEWMRYNK